MQPTSLLASPSDYRLSSADSWAAQHCLHGDADKLARRTRLAICRSAPSRPGQLRVAPSELGAASRALDVATRAQAAPRGRARRTSAQAERDWRCGARRRAAWRALRLELPCLLSRRVSFPAPRPGIRPLAFVALSACLAQLERALRALLRCGTRAARAVALARARRLDHTAKLRSTLAQHFRRVRPLARPPRALSIPLRRPERRRAGRAPP